MKKLLTACGLLLSVCLAAQVKVIPKSYVDSLNKLASNDSLYYFQKIKVAQKAFDAAQAINYAVGEFRALQTLGLSNLNLNKYDDALSNFLAAKKIGEDLDSLRFNAYATYYIGNVYNYLEDDKKAIENFEGSLNMYKELKDPLWQGVNLNGIGAVYGKMKKWGLSLDKFKECVQIFEDNNLENMMSIPLGNIGEYYYDQEKYEICERYFYKSFELAQKFKDPKQIASSIIKLAAVYGKENKLFKAQNLFEEALQISEEHQYNSLIVETKKEMSIFYSEQGKYEKSNKFLQESTRLNDSLINTKLTTEIAKVQASYEDEKRDRELAESREQITQLEFEKRIGFFTSLAAVLALIGLGLISWLFYSRNKAKRALMQTRLKNEEKERELLQKELKNKQQDLTNFALDISRKNELSEQLYNGLKSIVDSGNSEKAKAKAKELLLLTSNHLKINDDITKFQQNVDVVNQEFFNSLSKKFPDLTANEKQLCGLIRLNLSTKDIASVRNISPKSVEMGRYRLRKKLQLDSSDDIAAFMQNL
jgi:tetratricopeptide (TPR) repeat protein